MHDKGEQCWLDLFEFMTRCNRPGGPDFKKRRPKQQVLLPQLRPGLGFGQLDLPLVLPSLTKGPGFGMNQASLTWPKMTLPWRHEVRLDLSEADFTSETDFTAVHPNLTI